MHEDVDLTLLPPEFHDLVALIEARAVSDDVDRDARMRAATTEELRRLVEAVRPRFAAINAYLDDHDHLEEATHLGTLAEAAVEAGFELDDRGTA
ncbi:MAG: hypothetical protein QOJ35_906 [Solirubrobacteraceae bacterium]|nr:hypothetical protein [Solirubrobacteraceae bacterium]